MSKLPAHLSPRSGAHVLRVSARSTARHAWRGLVRSRAHLAPYWIMLAATAVVWLSARATSDVTTMVTATSVVALAVVVGVLVLSRRAGVSRPGMLYWLVTVAVLASWGLALTSSARAAASMPWLGVSRLGGVLEFGFVAATFAAFPHWRAMRRERLARPQPAPEVEETFPGVTWLKGATWDTDAAPTSTGWARRLRLPPGTDAARFLLERVGGIANVLGVREHQVELEPGPVDSLVQVRVHERDALATTTAWALRDAPRVNFWSPVPVGVDRSARPVSLALVERHLLIGGASGSGKSNLLALVVAAAALDPRVQLHLVDGKAVELPGWRGRAESYVGADLPGACRLLADLQEEMTRRYAWLAEAARRKVEPGDPVPQLVLVVDELASFLVGSDAQGAEDFRRRLLDLLQRGRAAGLVVVAGTQRPSTKLLSGDLRDGFTTRVCLRMQSRDGSTMVLGAGRGVDASRLPAGKQGVGYLDDEEVGSLVMFRASYLPDDELLALQRRTARQTVPQDPQEPRRAALSDVPTPTADELAAWFSEPPAAPGEPEPVQPQQPEQPQQRVVRPADTALRFPDGSPVPDSDRELWAVLASSPEPMTILEMVDAGPFSSATPVETRCRRWVRQGHATEGRRGKAKTYAVAPPTEQLSSAEGVA